jgi:dephospho-CoA kinase
LLKVGLTGSIASGKSVVGEMLAKSGAHVIQADAIAHELMQPGEPVYEEVLRRFGTGILNPDGMVNRPRLAEAAFGNPEAGIPSRIEELNQIVHPAVINRQDKWMEQIGGLDAGAVTVVEAALILEAGASDRFDRIIVVTCRPEQRIKRWAKKMKIDEERARSEISRRTAAQLPDDKKVEAADFVIDNSGSIDDTRRQVNELFSRLREEALRSVSR